MANTQTWTPHSYPVQSQSENVPRPRRQTADSGLSDMDLGSVQLPAAIPAVKDAKAYSSRGRNIIICLDGTGDKFDSDNSNIVHIVSCLKKDDPKQVTYYQSGIGTYDGGGLSNGMNAAFDMAVGSGLGLHIREAYQFIASVYREGDKICLFGFSRGAYTARCLAGMLHKVGLLPAHNIAQIPFAYAFYKDETENGYNMSLEFKKTFCQDVSVHFLGLFDSVASVGFIPRKLPLSSTPTNQPAYFRHAMALDEHRAKFKVCRFQHAVTKAEQEAESIQKPATTADVEDGNGTMSGSSEKTTISSPISVTQVDPFSAMKHVAKTDVLEVWFTGCHADVGGGAVKNEVRHKLSQIPLRWMIRQCFECNTGIVFHTKRLAEIGLDVHTLHPKYQMLTRPSIGPSPSLLEKYEAGTLDPIARRSTHLRVLPDRKHHHHGDEDHEPHARGPSSPHAPQGDWTPEQTEDYFDSLCPINDQLVQAKGWWILEAWPIKVRIHNKNSDKWVKKIRMNLGRFRPVLEREPNLHWSVNQRMELQKYKIRTRHDHDAVWNEVV